jgi:2,4-dienoyl-CoA reductase-like NADH-dependent reductase (Old Yellow Enzyme family)
MIRRKIESYLRRHGMSATEFGRRAARDPRLVHDVRRGRELGARLVERIETFMGDDA